MSFMVFNEKILSERLLRLQIRSNTLGRMLKFSDEILDFQQSSKAETFSLCCSKIFIKLRFITVVSLKEIPLV